MANPTPATEIRLPSDENIRHAANLLRSGELVAVPTETVYGLAGNALDPAALARIFAAKERPTFDPLIVHVAWKLGDSSPATPLERLEQLDLIRVSSLQLRARELANRLLQAFWPGPFTLILPKSPTVPDLATSGLGTVALRMPRHPVARALIEEAGFPLAAPSANRFGRISPTRAEHVLAELDGRIPLILDGGACEVGVESTVVLLETDGTARLLRPGGTSRDSIEAVLGHKLEAPAAPSAPGTAPAQSAPGMLESHYAPRKPLILLPAPIDALGADPLAALRARLPQGRALGLLAFAGQPAELRSRFTARFGREPLQVRVLSASGNTSEAARNLFTLLRELDESSAELLIAEPCLADPEGLGHAIQDRLSRASAPRS